VIRNAIRLVMEARNAKPIDVCNESAPDFHLQPCEYQINALRESLAILALPDFDRLAFVICVIEQYSILDCALLLKRSPKDVNNARVRALRQVVFAEERNRRESTATSPAGLNGGCGNGTGEIEGPCGSLID